MAQALARRGHLRLRLRLGGGLFGDGLRLLAGLLALGGRGLPGLCALLGLFLLGQVLACLAKQSREWTLAHARALRCWHVRGPPSRAACRRGRPDRPDRTSGPTYPSRAPRRTESSCGFAKRRRVRQSSPPATRLPPWREGCVCPRA